MGLGVDWSMASSTKGVVAAADKYPTITVNVGDQVTFSGVAGETHWFAVVDAKGATLAGPSADGKAFKVAWEPSKVGMYMYICPPHKGFMQGSIVVKAAGTVMATTGTINAEIEADFAIANTDGFKRAYHDQLKMSDALKSVAPSIESMTTTVKQGKRVRRAGSTLATVIVFSASADALAVAKALNAAKSAHIAITYKGKSYTATGVNTTAAAPGTTSSQSGWSWKNPA